MCLGEFNEEVHAFLIGLFYKNFKNSHGNNGINCFIKATQNIAEQRGHRMAQRALKDGNNLDYSAYIAYGEIKSVIPNKLDVIIQYPDCELQVSKCVWNNVFKKMNLIECGLVYCKEIDKGIVRGFNPNLEFELKSMIHNAPMCKLLLKNARLDKAIETKTETKKSWEYHCGHYYNTYRKYAITVFDDGRDIVENVNNVFVEKFGHQMLEVINNYLNTDFDRV